MDTLHDELLPNIIPDIKLAVPLASIETMRPGHRPDDECVDVMARAVAEATGSTMSGQPGKHQRQDCTVSKIIVTNQQCAGSFRVMGPLHTEDFRRAVRPATSESKKRKPGEIGHDSDNLEQRKAGEIGHDSDCRLTFWRCVQAKLSHATMRSDDCTA